MRRSPTTMLFLTTLLCGAIGATGSPDASGPLAAAGAATTREVAGGVAPSERLVSLPGLLKAARARMDVGARIPLANATAIEGLDARLRLNGSSDPSYVRALGQMPQAARPLAEVVHAVLYRGALPTELKAAMGLRIAQVNGSPYVAAHMVRILRGSGSVESSGVESSGAGSSGAGSSNGGSSNGGSAGRATSDHGRALVDALEAGGLERLDAPDRLAVSYADRLTRGVHGVTPEEFARTRAAFNDAEIVELTITVAFFNYFTRFAETLRLPVEQWALDFDAAPPLPPHAGTRAHASPRIALISDEEIAATSAALAAVKDPVAQSRGLGLGMANSQRAMLRAPELALPWRSFGNAVREKETVGRDIKLQVSFAVSVLNDCRYCTIHQVLGLRRLGVEPAKLMAMRKDDSVLTPREAVAVRFARALTTRPGAMTDEDYAALRQEFGELGALEVLLQTCTFAFMNRFTDGLLLPSEDEAVRVYQEVYGTGSR